MKEIKALKYKGNVDEKIERLLNLLIHINAGIKHFHVDTEYEMQTLKALAGHLEEFLYYLTTCSDIQQLIVDLLDIKLDYFADMIKIDIANMEYNDKSKKN